jgi:NAD(P)-dependent dehydrogenase (short-subunit alcohol dehydrogenase family)
MSNKIAVVTGAAGAVGRAVVTLFAKEGASILAVDSSNTVAHIGASIPEVSTSVVGLKADVTDEREWRAIIETAKRAFGRLDVLVTCAAIMHPEDGGIDVTPSDVWDLTMIHNVRSVWLSCRAVLPEFERQGEGAIVNIASIVALRGSKNPQLAYTASKGAVVALTRELAVAHAHQGIRVNTVCPGPLETGLLEQHLLDERTVETRIAAIPLRRLGRVDEVAAACLYLASDEASFTTGSELIVDGGSAASLGDNAH